MPSGETAARGALSAPATELPRDAIDALGERERVASPITAASRPSRIARRSRVNAASASSSRSARRSRKRSARVMLASRSKADSCRRRASPERCSRGRRVAWGSTALAESAYLEPDSREGGPVPAGTSADWPDPADTARRLRPISASGLPVSANADRAGGDKTGQGQGQGIKPQATWRRAATRIGSRCRSVGALGARRCGSRPARRRAIHATRVQIA